jgi:hypothetical protein
MRFQQNGAQSAGNRIDGDSEAGRATAYDGDVPFSFMFEHVQKLMPIHKQQISRGVYGCVSFEAARMVEKRTVQWKERLGSIAPRLAEFKRKGPLRRSPLAGASPFRVSKRFKKQRADRRKKNRPAVVPPGGS